jgi:hypothetical protein
MPKLKPSKKGTEKPVRNSPLSAVKWRHSLPMPLEGKNENKSTLGHASPNSKKN